MADLKTIYHTLSSDPFPRDMSLRLGDQELRFEKRSWSIDGEERGLRYGENPDQPAALYALAQGSLELGGVAFREAGEGLVSALTEEHMLQAGKHPGKINLTDVDNGINILQYLHAKPAAIILKHNNPCGAAWNDQGLETALKNAFWSDRIAAFGGTVVLNRNVDPACAAFINASYFEVVAAPDYAPEALAMLKKRKNLRILRIPGLAELETIAQKPFLDVKSLVDGGLIVQFSFRNRIRGAKDFLPATAERDGVLVQARTPTATEMPRRAQMGSEAGVCGWALRMSGKRSAVARPRGSSPHRAESWTIAMTRLASKGRRPIREACVSSRSRDSGRRIAARPPSRLVATRQANTQRASRASMADASRFERATSNSMAARRAASLGPGALGLSLTSVATPRATLRAGNAVACTPREAPTRRNEGVVPAGSSIAVTRLHVACRCGPIVTIHWAAMTEGQAQPKHPARSESTPSPAFDDMRVSMGQAAALAKLGEASRRGKLPEYRPGGPDDALFSASALGHPFDRDLLAFVTSENKDAAGRDSLRLSFALRWRKKMPVIFAVVMILTVEPGRYFLETMIPGSWGWGSIMWWYYPLTIIPLPFAWLSFVRKSRATTLESARESYAAIGKILDAERVEKDR